MIKQEEGPWLMADAWQIRLEAGAAVLFKHADINMHS